MLLHSQTNTQVLALSQPTSSHVSKRNARHSQAGALSRSPPFSIFPSRTLPFKSISGLRASQHLHPRPATMSFPPSAHFDLAIVIQTLALPCTLILCITSMLRERSISYQDEKRLVRLYKQHAFVFELVQFFVTLMACGFVAGNTVAAIEARSLVIDFASEEVTSRIVRSAIARNVWLVVSALCVLTCMSVIDSWRLPESLQDLTDSLFRLTRELVRGCKYWCSTSFPSHPLTLF